MTMELEKVLRVKSLAIDILEHLMEDKAIYHEADLKNVVEILARSVNDLTNVCINPTDHSSNLSGTITKMRVGYNIPYYGKSIKKLEMKAFNK